MRSAVSLLGGMAVSAAGVLVVIGSDRDIAGVLLIASGVLIAMLAQRLVGGSRPVR